MSVATITITITMVTFIGAMVYGALELSKSSLNES